MERMTNDRQFFLHLFPESYLSSVQFSHPTKKRETKKLHTQLKRKIIWTSPFLGSKPFIVPGVSLHLFVGPFQIFTKDILLHLILISAFWRVSNCQVYGISGHVVYLNLLKIVKVFRKNIFPKKSCGEKWRLILVPSRITNWTNKSLFIQVAEEISTRCRTISQLCWGCIHLVILHLVF